MGFGKWFLVLAAGGIGAGVVVAGMTTGKMQKYPDAYALGGEHRGAARPAYGEPDDTAYALPGTDFDSEEDGEPENAGFGPSRGRMVILGGPGWVDDEGSAGAPRWSDEDDDASDERPFIAAPSQQAPRFLPPGPRGYLPQQSPPRPAMARPAPGRDSAADSAARAAGAAADVLAAERDGA
ncbi:hypothetical protein [Novosphingobium lindaniclasticum]|uniref:Uncharacterized protein n=1 Tax=Novosphingobium lindaniclasticum LE124 TaxID=1096930 RepID=T0J1L8_9SPHN|nr:hypothetical protein [Novosphingobium lindaniclasticum]EQB18030.1 hypothetical protein L284_05725 [Novosphingobium lindaniclasticum LE124]